jgi:hypothetical protein
VPPGTEVRGHEVQHVRWHRRTGGLVQAERDGGAAGGAFGSTGAAGAADALARRDALLPGTKIGARAGGRGGAGQSSGGTNVWVASMKYFQICTG